MKGVQWSVGGRVQECPVGVAPRTCYHYVLLTFWRDVAPVPSAPDTVAFVGQTFQEHSLGCNN